MVKLDVKDKKILYELSKNCRIPTSTLSKKVALSREVVDYRIRRLVEKNVIVDFIADIDETRLGYRRHLIYLAFQNVDEQGENELIDYIIKHAFVSWTTTSTGKWSIIFDFLAQDLDNVHDFLNQLQKDHGESISDFLVASQLDSKHFNSKFYGVADDRCIMNVTEKHKIDEIDLKLLHLLSHNARVGYVELSKDLKLSPNAVKNRLNALLKSGIIKSFFIQPNKTNLGFEQYYVQLDFVNQTKQQEKKILNYIENHPNMNAYYKPLGHWSLEVAIFVTNPGDLRKIILELRNKFGSIMKVHDTMLFYEEPKSNYLPRGVFRS